MFAGVAGDAAGDVQELVAQGLDPHPAGGVWLGVQAGQGLQHDVEGAGEQPGPGPDRIDGSVGGGQVVQACAVLAFAEAFLDGGSVAEPGFESDQVSVVGGDVGDDEADGPDVIGGATEGERELVGLTEIRQ